MIILLAFFFLYSIDKNDSCLLDVVLEADVSYTISVIGSATIHLTGYAITVLAEEEEEENPWADLAQQYQAKEEAEDEENEGDNKNSLKALIDGDLDEDDDEVEELKIKGINS